MSDIVFLIDDDFDDQFVSRLKFIEPDPIRLRLAITAAFS
jgi:hypothetical protein